MKTYITYEEYTNLGGTLTETVFNLMSILATKTIDKYTNNRLEENTTELPGVLQYLMVDLIDIINIKESNKETLSLSSTSNDGYSESYKDVNVSYNKWIKDKIVYYLADEFDDDGNELIYRGFKEGIY